VVAEVLATAGFRVWAIDHSEDMLRVARRRTESRPGTFSLLQGDVVRLPFRDGTFDVVAMQGILHHVPLALDEVIAQALRVLRPGGEFYIAEPCDGLSLVGRILRSRLWFRPYDPSGEETDEEALVWEDFSQALKAAGLEYTARFLTHIPSAHFHYWLPAGARIAITRLLSFPFKRGDLLFVHGRKPGS
jgi:ubiquinone/menaquinone biosynthesis C-methylase UbiE